MPCRIGDEVQPHEAHVLVRNKVDEDLWGIRQSFSEQIIFENYSSSVEQQSYAYILVEVRQELLLHLAALYLILTKITLESRKQGLYFSWFQTYELQSSVHDP